MGQYKTQFCKTQDDADEFLNDIKYDFSIAGYSAEGGFMNHDGIESPGGIWITVKSDDVE